MNELPRPSGTVVLAACLALGLPVSGVGQIVYSSTTRFVETKSEILSLDGLGTPDVQEDYSVTPEPLLSQLYSGVTLPDVTSNGSAFQDSDLTAGGIRYLGIVGASIQLDTPVSAVNSLGSAYLTATFTVSHPVNYVLSGNIERSLVGTGLESSYRESSTKIGLRADGSSLFTISEPGDYSRAGLLQTGVEYTLEISHYQLISFPSDISGVGGTADSTISANLVLAAVPELGVTPVLAGLGLLAWAAWRRQMAWGRS